MEFHKILVPVGGTRADEGAMEIAGRLVNKKGRDIVCAVYVIPIARALPLETEVEPEIRKAEEILTSTEGLAERQGCRIETDLIQAREVGPAIIDEAIQRSVDAIILGVSSKKRFGQFSLGTVVPYVLKNAPCPVILFHQSAAEEAAS